MSQLKDVKSPAEEEMPLPAQETPLAGERGESLIQLIKKAIFPIIYKPAFAYLLVLVLLYPAWLGIRKTFEPEGFVVTQPLILDDMADRSGDGSGKTFTLFEDTTQFGLFFKYPALKDDQIRYDLEIATQSGDQVFKQEDINGLADRDHFAQVIPRKLFSPGSYRLNMIEVDRETGKPRNTDAFFFQFIE